jgi:diguanylate cyclase
VFIDLDGFKLVNDSYGHEVGDLFLKSVAKRLQALTRPGDSVFRVSGDEFVMVMPQLHTPLELSNLGEHLRHSLEQPLEVGDWRISASASIGIAQCPADGSSPADLLGHADTAMYQVKKNGKNGVRLYQRDQATSIRRRLALMQELKKVLFNEAAGLTLHYQPIYEASQLTISKVEALLRWHSESYGLVSPGEFIPLAEEAGIIHKLGEWVLHRACHEAKRWNDLGSTIKVCVNVSAHQFTQPDFVTVVARALQTSGLPAHCLELELTESVVIRAFERVRDALRELRQLGVSVALDDFGTGYSSLSYLEELDFDTIKLDRSFAQKLTTTSDQPHYAVAIVRAVVEIAAVLDVKVVAEGIETRAQLTTLRGLGCTYMQGYHLARPMPASQLNDVLRPVVTRVPVSSKVLELN